MGFAANAAGYPVLAVAMTALVAAAASESSVLAKVRVPGAAWFAARRTVSICRTKRFTGNCTSGSRLGSGEGIGTTLIYIAAILAVGAVLHYTVERPFLQLPSDNSVNRTLTRYAGSRWLPRAFGPHLDLEV